MIIKDKIRQCEIFIEKHRSHQASCSICPRKCAADRNATTGQCGETFQPRISSANLHQGEEPPISGQRGSGTIFFSGCNMHCVFCQNFPISQQHQATLSLSIAQLSQKILELQSRGAHNINFVTPSHEVLALVMALKLAYQEGLKIPVVYNTSAYDLKQVIRDLDGIIDVYLPDAKYSDSRVSGLYSKTPDYVNINRECLTEMFRQKGHALLLDDEGIVQNGIIIRHLLLPGQLENSRKVLKWISEELSPRIHISIMSQYFPAYKVTNSDKYMELNKSIEISDYEQLLDYAESLNLMNGWWQDPDLTGGA